MTNPQTVPCTRDDLEHRFDPASGWCERCGRVRIDGRGRRPRHPPGPTPAPLPEPTIDLEEDSTP